MKQMQHLLFLRVQVIQGHSVNLEHVQVCYGHCINIKFVFIPSVSACTGNDINFATWRNRNPQANDSFFATVLLTVEATFANH
jgi:hypothetical protein